MLVIYWVIIKYRCEQSSTLTNGKCPMHERVNMILESQQSGQLEVGVGEVDKGIHKGNFWCRMAAYNLNFPGSLALYGWHLINVSFIHQLRFHVFQCLNSLCCIALQLDACVISHMLWFLCVVNMNYTTNTNVVYPSFSLISFQSKWDGSPFQNRLQFLGVALCEFSVGPICRICRVHSHLQRTGYVCTPGSTT